MYVSRTHIRAMGRAKSDWVNPELLDLGLGLREDRPWVVVGVDSADSSRCDGRNDLEVLRVEDVTWYEGYRVGSLLQNVLSRFMPEVHELLQVTNEKESKACR